VQVGRDSGGAPAPPSEPDDGLRGILADAVRLCPEVVEALVVDADGVLVAHAGPAREPQRAEEIGVESQAATPVLGRIAATARLGGVAEWHVVGERGLLVVRRVPRMQLFVVLRIAPTGWLGRARFAARVTAGRLSERLAR
jgi:predicted regulator of Ras-like GTPase activity (Roadblock/LC7/MglB family)